MHWALLFALMVLWSAPPSALARDGYYDRQPGYDRRTPGTYGSGSAYPFTGQPRVLEDGPAAGPSIPQQSREPGYSGPRVPGLDEPALSGGEAATPAAPSAEAPDLGPNTELRQGAFGQEVWMRLNISALGGGVVTCSSCSSEAGCQELWTRAGQAVICQSRADPDYVFSQWILNGIPMGGQESLMLEKPQGELVAVFTDEQDSLPRGRRRNPGTGLLGLEALPGHKAEAAKRAEEAAEAREEKGETGQGERGQGGGSSLIYHGTGSP